MNELTCGWFPPWSEVKNMKVLLSVPVSLQILTINQ